MNSEKEPARQLVDIGDLVVIPAAGIDPFDHVILGSRRCRQLALYLTGKDTPGYEIWWKKSPGGMRQVRPKEVYVDDTTLKRLLKAAEELALGE